LPGGIAIGVGNIMAAPIKLEKQVNGGIGFNLVHDCILSFVFWLTQILIWIAQQATADEREWSGS
jgi:hypothetical protein